MRTAAFFLTFALGLGAGVTASYADFTVCNKSAERVNVAIGYQSDSYGWTSEGWWQLNSGKCADLLPGDLDNQYYYVYGEATDGSTWSGSKRQSGGFFCTSEHKFTYHNSDFVDRSNTIDCEGGGSTSTKFFEVDTGNSSDFTQDLND